MVCRCEKRAQDLQLPHLFVFARLALAQFALEHQAGSDQSLSKKASSQLAAHQGTHCNVLTFVTSVQPYIVTDLSVHVLHVVARPPTILL